MNVSNLKVGMVLKSYPDLCRKLEITPKRGGSGRIAQQNEIERYIKYSKGEGNKLVVDEVYKVPKLPFGGSGNAYNDLIQIMITDLIVEAEGKPLIITRGSLQRKLKMVNKNYSYCNANRVKFSNYINMHISYIHDFFNTSNSNFRSAIKTALDKLVDYSVISYTWVHFVCTNNGIYREATEQETKVIIDRQKEILAEMGFKKMSDVTFTSDWKEFESTLNYVLQRDIDIDFTYMSYKIIPGSYLNDVQGDKISLRLEEVDREKRQEELNDIMTARLLENAMNRQKKALNGESKATNEKILKSRKDLAIKGNTKELIYHVIDSANTTNIKKQIKELEDRRMEEIMGKLRENEAFNVK